MPTEHRQEQDAPRNDEVDRKAVLEPWLRGQLAFLNATAALHGLVKYFDAPTFGVPVQLLERVFGGRHLESRQQHPFQGGTIRGVDRCSRTAHRSIGSSFSAWRTEPHRRETNPQRGTSSLALVRARDIDDTLGSDRLLTHMRKEATVPVLDEPVMLRSHQELSPFRLSQGEREQLIDVGFAVANAHHLRVGTKRPARPTPP